MENLWKLIDKIEEAVISVFMASAVLLSFLQVILRYVFSYSITWAAEASTFLLIWTAIIGASYGIRKRVHIGVDTLVNMLPDNLFRLSVHIGTLLSLVYTITLTYLGFLFIKFLLMIGIVSPDLEWPLWIIFMVVPFGNLFMTIRFVQQLVGDLKHPPEKQKRGVDSDVSPLLRDDVR